MTDSLETIYCPACGKPMEKVAMQDGTFHVDVCLTCGGMWFDNREIKKVDEEHEDITPILKLLEGKEFIKVDKDTVRVCPVCQANMVKHYVSALHSVEIDDCYSCGGMFFDADELLQMRNQFSTEEERSNAAKIEAYQEYGHILSQLDMEAETRKGSFIQKMFASLLKF